MQMFQCAMIPPGKKNADLPAKLLLLHASMEKDQRECMSTGRKETIGAYFAHSTTSRAHITRTSVEGRIQMT